jgi:nitric oxide synthase-interacting protein
MSRHSKNNTGSSVFTYGERQKLKNLNEWGDITTRLGEDSQKKFEQCSLCLNIVINAVTCPKGHVYCKECVVENLLYQKQRNKKIISTYKQQQQEALSIKSKESVIKEKDNKQCMLKKVEDNEKVKVICDVTERNGDNKVIMEGKQFVKAKTESCFWIPEQTPTDLKEGKRQLPLE